MNLVVWSCGLILGLAVIGTLYRLWRGPSLLDRVISSDVLLTIISATLCIMMIARDSYEYLPVLLVVSMIGFISSVTVARFASNAPVGGEVDRLAQEQAQEQVERDLAAGRREETEA